jgi:hypothetical protein
MRVTLPPRSTTANPAAEQVVLTSQKVHADFLLLILNISKIAFAGFV